MTELGTEAPPPPTEPLWQMADLQDLQGQWEANEIRRKRLLRHVGVGVTLLLASVAAFVFAVPRMVGTRWASGPAIAIWASLLLTVVPTVNLWAAWRIGRILVGGLTEARAYLGVRAETGTPGAIRRDGAG
jgi:hypothetical protein